MPPSGAFHVHDNFIAKQSIEYFMVICCYIFRGEKKVWHLLNFFFKMIGYNCNVLFFFFFKNEGCLASVISVIIPHHQPQQAVSLTECSFLGSWCLFAQVSAVVLSENLPQICA